VTRNVHVRGAAHLDVCVTIVGERALERFGGALEGFLLEAFADRELRHGVPARGLRHLRRNALHPVHVDSTDADGRPFLDQDFYVDLAASRVEHPARAHPRPIKTAAPVIALDAL
jgi:hypothetical protein